MIEETPAICETKVCPICINALPVSEFGVCRARKDGRNLYCKTCIRKKVTNSRRALKEYKTARKKYVADAVLETDELIGMELAPAHGVASATLSKLISRLSPVDRVREAIRKGARTQKEIAQETKLGKDEIGEALANLLLWTREIRTEVLDNTRMYFTNELETLVPQEISQPFPRRKGDMPSSFSALQGLMPGRSSEDRKPEKPGVWVAA